MTQKQENSKELKLSIPTPGKGPGDVPLVIGAHDTPGAIKGAVSFECNYDCKGSNIIIKYTALAEVRWSTKSGNKTIHYRGRHLYDKKIVQMTLQHTQEGKVSAGKYLCPFYFSIDAMYMPSSFVGTYAWMTYKVRATLVRKFPSVNLVREQVVWVLNSALPRPERPLIDTPTQMTRYKGVLMKTVPYICIIPSNVIYLGQQVPITIKILPAESPVQVMSGVIKLKQYTTLNVRGGEKSNKKELLNVTLKDGWPQAEARNSWQRTIVVPIPGFPQVTPSISSPMITKSHILKLILNAKIGKNGHRSELRVEMPVTITGPRPAGEPYPSFDLHRYLACVDKI
ncbi:hypothetical protein BGZ80_010822 [Entomortierella chlamydospora]|uniref:Arrestin C-terminal-like domain-containing protein n=1 Tax=Entomortierella chlamydospora TaxID=101097 RepID=A0A9P6SZG0_9FUNG|nr:hypothetical protein BGZ79_006342 [Entomortierella chlamydospora]KAG0013813.1 hypothetical protein BGZ80_010822 [Entomortierella chlamydospora]